MEKDKSVSAKITEYIIDNQLSAREISRATGVSEEKLTNKAATLNAVEFLEICAHLNVRPEEFRTENMK